MLHRHRDSHIVVITQPAHAWISGQIAADWGNPDHGLSPASLELQISAEQHDIAWLDWEQHPTLNTRTGLPHAFNEMPTLEHLDLWGTAMPRALAYGRLPALLISKHGTYLYRRFHDYDRDSSREAARAKEFLQSEELKQESLLSQIQAARDISQSEITRMRQLLSLWDAMSLALCMGLDDSRTFQDVPAAVDGFSLSITPTEPLTDRFVIEPWPFKVERLEVECEGRRLGGTFKDEQLMRDALVGAETVPLRFSLVPA